MDNSKLLIPQSVLSQSQSFHKAATLYCAITFTTSDRPVTLWNCSQCNIHALIHGILRSDPHRIFLNLTIYSDTYYSPRRILQNENVTEYPCHEFEKFLRDTYTYVTGKLEACHAD